MSDIIEIRRALRTARIVQRYIRLTRCPYKDSLRLLLGDLVQWADWSGVGFDAALESALAGERREADLTASEAGQNAGAVETIEVLRVVLEAYNDIWRAASAGDPYTFDELISPTFAKAFDHARAIIEQVTGGAA